LKTGLQKECYTNNILIAGGMALQRWWQKSDVYGGRFAPAGVKIKDLVLLTGLIETGKFKAVIDRYYSLGKKAEAHRFVEKGQKWKCSHLGGVN
jgi:NADPH:quinone reductase-like Zn-dependent oxidoreductase